MNKDVKAKWVAALRSGEYRQGFMKLRTDDGRFCCLGVLCDLAVKEGVIPEPVLQPAGIVHTLPVYYYDDSATSLTETVLEWAGLDTTDPVLIEGDEEKSPITCMYANDTTNNSFEEIADLIEENL